MNNELPEFFDSAGGIFLSSVQRSYECTGERSTVNIVSSALMRKILEELMPEAKDMPGKPHCGDGSSLFGYQVRVVDSPHIFAIAIDQEQSEKGN